MNKFVYSGIIAFVVGTIYYINMSWSIPKESNCSFSANIWTDIAAFIIGAFIVRQSIIYDDIYLNIVGVAIITEHIWQLVHNKVGFLKP